MKLRVLFLESFYGGSHRDFADGLMENSHHAIELVTLPGRFWKWRIRGAALSFLKLIPDPRGYDVVIATDLLSLADLAALWPSPRPPIVLYMHENQISYPVPVDDKPEYHFAFANITSALVADHIIFNSHFHMSTFLHGLTEFLTLVPEFKPLWTVDEIKAKSRVLFPGCRFMGIEESSAGSVCGPPLIVWNHRWEFDKNPDGFFGALKEIDEAGIDFNLAVMGECSQKVPKPFVAAKKRYGRRVLVYGYVESREEYYRWLNRGDIVISTALQENFGIAVIEAIRMGCFPILPARLSYPEVLPEEFHQASLYSSRKELVTKLKAAVTRPRQEIIQRLQNTMGRYDWKNLIDTYDDMIETAAKIPHKGM